VTELLLRAAGARVFERADALFLLHPRGGVHRLDGDSAALARAVLSLLETERTRAELFAALAELVGGPVEPASVVDDLLALLRQTGAVQIASRAAVARPRASRGLRVVLGVTGAVQSIHTPWLVSLLLNEGHDVRVAMTENALRFCREEGLEALTHHAVVTSLWAKDAGGPAPHIRLAEWADLVVVAPASATTIARLAGGSCDDIVSAVAIATRAPVVIAPSMNVAMADAPSVRRNVSALREDGFIVVHPTVGHEVALSPSERTAMRGTMPTPPEFVAILRAIIATAPARRGPLTAPLDASWDARYARAPSTRPWESDAPDDGLVSAFERWTSAAGAPLRVLDAGCGSGLVATALAAVGCDVCAIDLSPNALDLARARPGAERVTWVQGDALTATFAGRFDYVCDRALLHVLPAAQQRAWAQRASSLLLAKGALVLTAHSEHAPVELGTSRLNARAVAELFDGLLELESIEPVAMKGPDGTTVSARRYVLRKG
jgi:3-polyprenyl-4-hydroxybenzoate decarboxylase